MNPASLSRFRDAIRVDYLADEHQLITTLIADAELSSDVRASISERAATLVRTVRAESSPTLVEKFLAEYGLTTDEGVALMCLAEALLRVPDDTTIQALIDDKVGPGDWSAHLGQSKSSLINVTTWGLMVAGKLITPFEKMNLAETLRSLTKRLGDPMVRTVAAQAMAEMGRQFVLGRDINEALTQARTYESKGYTYSYDMLGEAARTEADAVRYFQSYANAITSLAPHCNSDDIRENPGISVKLSALHPRYEAVQHKRVIQELVPRALQLAQQAKAANMGFNIDAEEADRLDISLDVIELLLSDPSLEGWDGFGVVVQAYGKRASKTLDWLYAIASQLDRKIMVRLVKGAYWDAEIKRAQVLGLEDFPVFTRKACTDVGYITCAKKLLSMRDRIYPQFATHNAHSVSAILELAKDNGEFEFQRLHGMGESLHATVKSEHKNRCRIYAPVGQHRDLLAYLVRRLLENGANSSFVNQIVDTEISPESIATDPFAIVQELGTGVVSKVIARPSDIYGNSRRNSKGWDITDPIQQKNLEQSRQSWRHHFWSGGPIVNSQRPTETEARPVMNPAIPEEQVGQIYDTDVNLIPQAIDDAIHGFNEWSTRPMSQRAEIVARVGRIFEDNAAELFALATREAGKTLNDAIAEVREAVDFAYYYADQIANQLTVDASVKPRGVIACISPWNFPLAIFSGQILANIAAGNAVLAKPAEQSSLMAVRAVQLMHDAGVPRSVLQLLPGDGAGIGTALTSDPRIAGVCFTGSTATAQSIDTHMANHLKPDAPLVAETGGLNAMIVDSTALPEQVVKDVVESAFQSAGQRCSALRMLYLQEDIAEHVLNMLFGAMEELQLGDPWLLNTDIGPVIDQAAQQGIAAYCAQQQSKGRILKQLATPSQGTFIVPTVIKVEGIEDLTEEIFGPVLHVATFAANDIESVVDQINSKGYGLTFGLHTRVDTRVDQLTSRIAAGNVYVNRNQIGAIVGSQPFGGEGLSGTGPKAGGPHYVRRFMVKDSPRVDIPTAASAITAIELADALKQVMEMQVLKPADRLELMLPHFRDVPTPLDWVPTEMPGPTGELNLYSCVSRGTVICAGPDNINARVQAMTALSQGNRVIAIAPQIGSALPANVTDSFPIVCLDGLLQSEALFDVNGFAAVASDAEELWLTKYRQQLARRDGPLVPLITETNSPERYVLERHLCIDTTAAGGNASLVASSE